MKYLVVVVFAVIKMVSGQAQSESHDFITYDSAIYVKVNQWDSARFSFRITRPKVLDGRGMLFSVPGKDEQLPNTSRIALWGPHFWLANGWDGSVTLDNGKHYPMIVTMVAREGNTYPGSNPLWDSAFTKFIKIYKPNPKATHLMGLSYGSWVVSILAASPDLAKYITSFIALSGAGTSTTDFTPLGVWAKQGGKGFLTVGYADVGNNTKPPLAAAAMQAASPGSVYFTYNSVFNGQHGDWNTIYNPANNQWWIGNVITTRIYQDSYKDGWNIYQWGLRQGDTSLVGSPVIQPPLNIPPVAALTYTVPSIVPVTYIVLDGSKSYDTDGTIDSTWITQVSGPNQAFLVTSVCDTKGVACGLIPGTYVFQLKVKDNKGSTGSSLAQLVISAPAKTVILTLPLPITFLGVTITKILTVYSDGTYLIQ